MKRLFIGLQAEAPWPDTYPKGRLLEEKDRHLTLKFLGPIEENAIETLWKGVKSLPTVGFGGVFDKPFFTTHTAGWHVQLPPSFDTYIDDSSFLPHVTCARGPFRFQEWEKAFSPLPVLFYRLHLYESLGFSKYAPLKTQEALPPFEEIEHTADIAFLVRGCTPHEIYWHAKLALSFRDPHLLLTPHLNPSSLEDLIAALNGHIQECDRTFGTPFKAVSYHGSLVPSEGHLAWEMIVDV
jgi:hypothetical protein